MIVTEPTLRRDALCNRQHPPVRHRPEQLVHANALKQELRAGPSSTLTLGVEGREVLARGTVSKRVPWDRPRVRFDIPRVPLENFMELLEHPKVPMDRL